MSTMHENPRFTLRGSATVERHIGFTISRAAGLVAKHFRPHERRALVLLGGYGRGEGGAIHEYGNERPHNNIDFLLVTDIRGGLSGKSIKKRLDDVLTPLAHECDIGIDTGVISAFELRHAPARVIWFDLRWGHRTILGDAALIPSLPSLPAAAIEMEDIHDLLVNRASLLVVNDVIFDQRLTSELHTRFVVKHLMKAIIGHGDAFLFTRGRYHASYVEKQRRMREFSNIVPGLAELYDIAAEFRFTPDYSRYTNVNLGQFAKDIRGVLARAYLAFERHRSGNSTCTFSDHIDRVLLAKPSYRTKLSHVKHILVNKSTWFHRPNFSGLSSSMIDAVRRHHPRVLMAATLPIVLHQSSDEQMQLACAILGAEEVSPRALRQAYLRYWGVHGDPNFRSTAQRLGLVQ